MSPRKMFCLCLSITALLGSAAEAAKPKLTKFQSRRYVVYTDLPIEQAKPYAAHMDAVYDEYNRRLSKAGFRARSNTRFPFYLLKDHKSYVAFLKSIGIDGEHSGGMFFPGRSTSGLATFVGRQSEARIHDVVEHEGFHQFAHLRIGRLPFWVNEGMAEYFEAGTFIGKKYVTGQANKTRLEYLRRELKKGTAIPFKDVILMTGAQWHENMGTPKGQLQYAQSWSMVHFLVHGERGKYQKAFMDYLTHINKGQSSGHAFEKAFGPNSYEPFEKKWKQYLMQLEADPLYTAQRRLEFLAAGMQKLYERDETVSSMDDLKTKLRAIDFKRERRTHAGKEVYDSADDEMFEAPEAASRTRTSSIAMLPTNTEGLPPTITVRGLQAKVRIEWSGGDSDRLQWKVVLE